MQKPPRPPGEPLFDKLMIRRVLLSALVVGSIGFGCFIYAMALGQDELSARNSTLLLMVLFENIQVLNSRSETRSVFTQSLFSNPLLIVATLMAQGLHIAAMHWPPMQRILSISPATISHWVSLLGAALVILLVIELDKLISRVLARHAATKALQAP